MSLRQSCKRSAGLASTPAVDPPLQRLRRGRGHRANRQVRRAGGGTGDRGGSTSSGARGRRRRVSVMRRAPDPAVESPLLIRPPGPACSSRPQAGPWPRRAAVARCAASTPGVRRQPPRSGSCSSAARRPGGRIAGPDAGVTSVGSRLPPGHRRRTRLGRSGLGFVVVLACSPGQRYDVVPPLVVATCWLERPILRVGPRLDAACYRQGLRRRCRRFRGRVRRHDVRRALGRARFCGLLPDPGPPVRQRRDPTGLGAARARAAGGHHRRGSGAGSAERQPRRPDGGHPLIEYYVSSTTSSWPGTARPTGRGARPESTRRRHGAPDDVRRRGPHHADRDRRLGGSPLTRARQSADGWGPEACSTARRTPRWKGQASERE